MVFRWFFGFLFIIKCTYISARLLTATKHPKNDVLNMLPKNLYGPVKDVQDLKSGLRDVMYQGDVPSILDLLGPEVADEDDLDEELETPGTVVDKLMQIEWLGKALRRKSNLNTPYIPLKLDKFVSGETYIRDVWNWVPFEYRIKDPVVFTGPAFLVYPAEVAIKGVTETGFYGKLRAICDPGQGSRVSWIAITRGTYILGGGKLKMEVNKMSIVAETEIIFNKPFSTPPAVIAARQDNAGARGSTVRILQSQNSNFTVGLQRYDEDKFITTSGSLGYLAIQQGSTSIPLGGGVEYRFRAEKTQRIFDDTLQNYLNYAAEGYSLRPCLVASISKSSAQPVTGMRRIQVGGEPSYAEATKFRITGHNGPTCVPAPGPDAPHFVSYLTLGRRLTKTV